jgi:2,5-diketo-D-gluconate reductase B
MTNQKYLSIQGEEVPALGFGTYTLLGNDCYTGVRDALEIGYRHIDTAQIYTNEEETGKAIRESSISRDDIFLTTKVSFREATPANVIRSTEESLRKLGLDQVNLLLLHWPNKEVPVEQTLEALLKLKEQGKTRHIGVSNFPLGLLRRALDFTPLFALQVEYHPFLGQNKLLEMVRQNDMVLTAYSPVAQGMAAKNKILQEIGEKHGKSAVQVALRWLMQQDNVSAIPRAKSHEHRKQNYAIWDFELSSDEMQRIFDLDSQTRIVVPVHAPDWNS